MTRQNRKHKYVCEIEKNRKNFIRGFDRELGKRTPRHLRKWWADWHKIKPRWVVSCRGAEE